MFMELLWKSEPTRSYRIGEGAEPYIAADYSTSKKICFCREGLRYHESIFPFLCPVWG